MDRIIEPTITQLRFSSLYPSLILASSSPNRKLLLEKGGSIVDTFTPLTDESTIGLETEEAMIKNAKNKMEAYTSSPFFDKNRVAISADTLVEIEHTLLGKPKDRIEAKKMLNYLSGKKQIVYTGCSLYIPQMGVTTFCDKAEVVFKKLTEKTIESYLDKKEYIGAAGSYRLQKTGYTLVERIIGDWTTVVGLPLMKLIKMKEESFSSSPFNPVTHHNALSQDQESL